MKKYILKYPVYNSIDFPAGIVVELVERKGYTSFKVLEGPLKGEQGDIAQEKADWFIEYNPKVLNLFNKLCAKKLKLENKIDELEQEWNRVQTAKL